MSVSNSFLSQPRILSLLFLFSACGDDKEGSASDAGADSSDSKVEGDAFVEAGRDGSSYEPISLETFCTEWRAVAEQVHCAEVSADECENILNNEGALRCQSVVESIASGRTRYDGAEAARCLAETNTAALAQSYEFGFITGCRAFQGAVEPGGNCFTEASINTDECADGYCVRQPESCPGTCRAFQPRGDTCNSELRCGPSNYCFRACQPPCDGTCRQRPGEGEDCEVLCQSGLICAENKCRSIKPEGASCELHAECEQGFCRDKVCQKVADEKGEACATNANCPADLICDFEQGGTCQNGIALGEPCPGGNDVCADDGICAYPIEGGDSTCVANLGQEGDPCTYLCEDDHFCSTEGETQVCRPDRGEGEDCATNTAIGGAINLPCQDGLHCMESSSQTCLPPGKLNEPCFYNRTETCEPGLWCTIAGSSCIEPATGDEFCYALWPDTCLSTHYCGTEDAEQGGWGTDKCYPKLALEEPCLEDRFCASNVCIRESEEDAQGTCANERTSNQPDRCVP